VDGRIDTEISDRQAAVTQLTTDLAAEVTNRQSDVQSVRDVTDNHEGRLTSAESTIAGLGTMSTQNSDSVNITGGTITGVTVNAQSMEVGTGATADLYVGNDGKVGIGTEAPTERLTVNGNIDMLSNRIKNLADGVDSTDAATKGQVDAKADKFVTVPSGEGDVVYGAQVLWDGPQAMPSLALYDGEVGFYNGMEEAYRKDAQTNFSDALDLQKKLVVSETAPAHIDGREWLDTTDFRRYISISNAWVESITA
jgi:hypothetical protein